MWTVIWRIFECVTWLRASDRGKLLGTSCPIMKFEGRHCLGPWNHVFRCRAFLRCDEPCYSLKACALSCCSIRIPEEALDRVIKDTKYRVFFNNKLQNKESQSIFKHVLFKKFLIFSTGSSLFGFLNEIVYTLFM